MFSSLLPTELFTGSRYTFLRVLLFIVISIGIFVAGGGGSGMLIVCFIIGCIVFGWSYQWGGVVSLMICLTIIGTTIIGLERLSESLSVLLYYSLCSTVFISLYEGSKFASSINTLLGTIDDRYERIYEMLFASTSSRYQKIISKPGKQSNIIKHIVDNGLIYASGVLLLWIRGPLLTRGGYLHMLDFSITSYLPWSDITTLQFLILKIASYSIPTRIGEKILRVGGFIIGGIGVVKCCRSLDIGSKRIHRYALCLLRINPFVYARSIDGQINVVLITMVLPRLLYTIIAWYHSRTPKNIRDIIIVELILGTISPHGFIIGIGVVVTFLICIALQYNKEERKKIGGRSRIVKDLIYIIGGSIAVNLFWIIPAMIDPTNIIHTVVNSIDQFHLKAYETHNLMRSITFNPLALVGYRGEVRQRFIVHTGSHARLSYTIILIWIGTILGLKYIKKYHHWIRGGVIGSLIVAWIAAQGVNYISLFSELNSRIMNVLPPLKGMRDAHKRTAWIVVVLIIGSSMGLHSLIRSKKGIGWIYVSRLLPFLYTPMMVGGMHGQVTSTPYPSSWNEVTMTLRSDQNITPYTCESNSKCYDILVLPWHSYMYFRHAQRVTTTPFYNYFLPYRARVAHNVEFNNEYYSQAPGGIDQIDKFLGYPHGEWRNIVPSLSPSFLLTGSNYTTVESFIKLLREQHTVHYLLLLKESDYANYLSLLQYLSQGGWISQSLENDDYILYIINKNKVFEYRPKIEPKV